VTRILRSPAAERDLEYVWLTIAADNPFAAARALVERPYLILYETHPDTNEGPVDWVEIVRVVDGRRDLPSVL